MPWAVAAAAISAGAAYNSAEEAGDVAHQQYLQGEKAMSQQDRLLQEQIRQADELLAFNKEQAALDRARQDKVDAINERVTNTNLDLSMKAGQRADESYDFYKQYGRPVVQRSLQEANTWDSPEQIQQAQSRAAANVQQAADDAASQNQRALTRLGINPSAGRFMELQQQLQATKMLGKAQAMTGAEDNMRMQGVQLRQQASNLAQGFPAQSMNQAGQASSFGVAGAGVAGAGQAQNLGLSRQFMDGMGQVAGMRGSAIAGYGNIADQRFTMGNNIMGQANANSAAWGSFAGNLMGMWGNNGFKMPSFGGGYTGSGTGFGTTGTTGNINDPYGNGGFGMANGGKVAGPDGGGGKVVGPGTGTSDSVEAVNGSNGQPIRLSNGEYVIPADVVKKLGTAHFDNLLKKHHKHVNIGRAA